MKKTDTWFPKESSDERCPYNMRVVCVEQSPCERCGWYPPEARSRREKRNRTLQYGMPDRCVDCKMAKLCKSRECAKPGCDYYVNVNDHGGMPDLRLEQEERV